MNSIRSEGEQDLIFTVNFAFENVMCKVKLFFHDTEAVWFTFEMLLCIHGDCKQQLKV